MSQLATPLHHHSSSSALDGCQQHCFCNSGQLDLAWRRVRSVEEGSIKDFQDLPSCLLSFSSSSDHSGTEGPESERTLLALIKLAKIAQASTQAFRDESFINESQCHDNIDNYLHGQGDKRLGLRKKKYGTFSLKNTQVRFGLKEPYSLKNKWKAFSVCVCV